jgi:hypothetical protein
MFDNLIGLHRKKTKLTTVFLTLIEHRFRDIYPENRKNYNTIIRQEVQEKFNITLSSEAVRQVIAPIHEQLDTTANQTTDKTENTTQIEAVENSSPVAITDSEIASQEPKVIEVEATETSQQHTRRDDLFHLAELLVLNGWGCSRFLGTIKDQRAYWLYGCINPRPKFGASPLLAAKYRRQSKSGNPRSNVPSGVLYVRSATL